MSGGTCRGVCVGVNVVKGIKWWWCVTKAYGTTNTCRHCITLSTPVQRLQHFRWKLGGREWRYEHVHVQICMEDGVCVGVNVVEGIGSGALPRHKRHNKYL